MKPFALYLYGNPAAMGAAPVPVPINVALAANGGVASATTSLNSSYLPANANDGSHPQNGGAGTYYHSGSGTYAGETLTVDFGQSRTISNITIWEFTVPDDQSYDVQVFNGSWATVGTRASGLSVRPDQIFDITPQAASKARIVGITASYAYMRIPEFEVTGY